MNVYRTLSISNGDAVNTFTNFLSAWWPRADFTAILAPVELPDHTGVEVQSIDDPAELFTVNPFAPVMMCNAASEVRQFVEEYPRGRLGIILRPCELKALVELNKRHRILSRATSSNSKDENIILIGVDCPGTFPVAEYAERALKRGADAIIQEVLAHGMEDSVSFMQLRPACQLCDWPAPQAADVTVGTLGVAAGQVFLVIARDEFTHSRLSLQNATDRMATEEQVVLREETIGSLAKKRVDHLKKLCADNAQQFGSFCSLMASFARCTLCADCLDACPLYEGELSGMIGLGSASQRNRPLLPELISVSRWLVSCSGCGMCQEACQCGVPLAGLVSILSHRIREEMHYTAGDPRQRLPWAAGLSRS